MDLDGATDTEENHVARVTPGQSDESGGEGDVMADGDKILGVGPKMLVAIVFSALMVSIVAGKWGSIHEVRKDDVSIIFGGASPPSPPARVTFDLRAPAIPLAAEGPAVPPPPPEVVESAVATPEDGNAEFEKIKRDMAKLSRAQQEASELLNKMDDLARSSIQKIKADQSAEPAVPAQ